MSACLICPSWGPCKCEGGPVLPTPTVLDKLIASAEPYLKPVPKAGPRINIRQKGAQGEREVINVLVPIVQRAMQKEGFAPDQIARAEKCIQRNQNQSAVGGNDLSHTFGLSFEVKRQEQLSINTWWKQCEAAAKPNNELPVLVYRQNKQAWRVVTYGYLWLPGSEGSSYGNMMARLEMDWPTFQSWFEEWVTRKLRNGEMPQGVKD